MMMKHSQSSGIFFKSLICLLFIYLLGHLSPFLPASTISPFTNLSFQSLAYADEEDDDEEDEDEEDEDEGEEEEGGEESTEGEEEGGEEEEDLSYLTDIGPAAEHEFEEYSFLGFSNRKLTWAAAQLHILFASFILGCSHVRGHHGSYGCPQDTRGSKSNHFIKCIFRGSYRGCYRNHRRDHSRHSSWCAVWTVGLFFRSLNSKFP